MPKTKVNNNIKLKSGGGLINDATDGLSVGDLPAIDGSKLTGIGLVKIGTISFGGGESAAQTITTGFLPRKIKVSLALGGNDFSLGFWNAIDGNICSFSATNNGVGVDTKIYKVTANNLVSGVIQNVTATSFDIKPSGGGSGTISLLWEAEQ